jgi:hypothetical protein
MTTYLLDSNVFIEAKNRYYGLDFCPAFWEWVIQQHRAGRVFSIEKVGDELAAGQDQLATWASGFGAGFFLPPNPAMLPSLSAVSQWVSGQGFLPSAVTEFLQGADYYLVASAHANNHVVVTHEVHSNAVKRVKIPTVCIGMGVKFMNTFEMLRKEQARFIL